MSSMNNQRNNQVLFRPSSVSSLHSTCLDNLRFSKKKEKATHLLAYMSECIEDKQEVQVQQAQQLCCYDRMKRLILNSNSFVDQKDLQNKLSKALIIETKINGLEKSYNKLNQQNQKKYQNLTKKKSYNYVTKKSIIEEIKEKSYQKFINMYRNNREQQSQQFKIQIEKEIQNKINKILETRDTNHTKILHENIELKRIILQKNLQIERIKSQLIHLKQNKIQEVSEVQPQEICNKITQSQQWLEQFKENFPNMSIQDVHNKMQQMKNSCLVKFDWVYHQQQKQYKQQKQNLLQSIENLKQNIKNIEQRENKLTENYQKLKEENQSLKKRIIYIEDSEGKIKMYEKTIESLYSQWYKHLHESEKKMMKALGHFKQDYNYKEMLEYIVNYCKKFNSNGKLNEYIIKILRGIQKLRRVVFPKQSNQKLDPFLTVQKLQRWIKRRVLLEQKNNTNTVVKKTSVDSQIQYLQVDMN